MAMIEAGQDVLERPIDMSAIDGSLTGSKARRAGLDDAHPTVGGDAA
jgi:hypothetical protein